MSPMASTEELIERALDLAHRNQERLDDLEQRVQVIEDHQRLRVS
jgi:hypothetical protein